MKLLFLLVFGGFGLAYQYNQHRRLRAAMDADISDDVCIACDSKEVVEQAPGVYRCMMCGYQGGPGMAAMLANQRKSEVEAMSDDQRWALGRTRLGQARSVLLGVQGAVDASLIASRRDMWGGGEDVQEEKQRRMAEASGELARAHNLLRDAGLLLAGRSMVEEVDPIDFLGDDFALDVQMDNVFRDRRIHQQIGELQAVVNDLLLRVERWIESTGGALE